MTAAGLAQRWRSWWFRDASLLDLAGARIVLALLVLYLDAGGRFDRVAMVAPWTPVPVLEAMDLGRPDAQTIAWTALATRAALVASCAGLLTNLSLAAAFVLQFVQEAWLNSLGKVTHATLPMLYALAFLALSPCGARWSLDAAIRRLRRGGDPPPRRSPHAGWPLELIFLEIAMFYFQAGLAKLGDAGLAWADGWTLQFYLLAKGGPAAERLAASPALCCAASVAVLTFELAFPVAVFVRRLRPLAMVAGLVFHAATAVFLQVVFWPLWSLYALFLPWEAIASRLSTLLRRPRRPFVPAARTA